jgi:curli biogenesis system outer membrane secretion channel CsgG
MNRKFIIAAALLVSAFFHPAAEASKRSAAARAEFMRTHVCPVDNKIHTPKQGCKGYVIDHIIPLCAGGRDHPANMQYQEYYASLKKDVVERKQCRALRT